MSSVHNGPTHRSGLAAPDWVLLRRLPLFEGLDADTLERLLAHSRVESWPRGSQLFRQDEPARHFYVILVGWVKLYRTTAEGHESVVHVFTRGESFAEAAIFAGGRYPVSAGVADTTRLLAVPAEPFLRTLEAEPTVARNMLAAMSRHLRQLVTALEQLQAHSAPQRLATFLVGIAPAAEGEVELRLPIDKALIAARLGMQPETLSRALARLRRVGLEVEGDRIRVPEMDRLRRVSEGA